MMTGPVTDPLDGEFDPEDAAAAEPE